MLARMPALARQQLGPVGKKPACGPEGAQREPHSEIIRKGKASKPTELGKMVQVQETENQIITHRVEV